MQQASRLRRFPEFQGATSPGLHGESLAALRSDWLLQLEAEGKQPNTRKNYRAALDEFVQFLEREPGKPTYDGVTHRLATRWIVYLLRERKMKERSINGHLSAIKSFYRWLRIENFMTQNPLQDVRCLKSPRLLPKPISEPWVKRILVASSGMQIRRGHNGRARALGDRALFEALYASGGRIGEMCGINVGDVNFQNRTIVVMGKYRRERIVRFGAMAALAIKKWLAFRTQRGEDLRPETPLWVGCRWLKMDKKTIRNHLREAATAAGYPERIWPHRFRHSFCTHLLDHGADLREVQELAGHDNIASTTVYTAVSPERLNQIWRRSHPRSGAEHIERP